MYYIKKKKIFTAFHLINHDNHKELFDAEGIREQLVL